MKIGNSNFTSIVVVLAIATLSGCAAKKNPGRDALNAEKALKAKKEAAANMKKDVSSMGGQPSRVDLYGTIADPKYKEQITASTTPGFSWKGVRPPIQRSFSVHVHAQAPESHIEAVNSVTSKDYINLGCDQKTLDGAVVPGTLTEKKVDPKLVGGTKLLQANTIVICGTNSIGVRRLTELKSVNLYMFNSVNLITEKAKHVRSLAIFTRDLFLSGDNKLSSVIPPGSVTADGAGLISITVSGEIKDKGTLNIYSEGSSYKEDPPSTGKGGKEKPGATPAPQDPSAGGTPDGSSGGSEGQHGSGGHKGHHGGADPAQPAQQPQASPSPSPSPEPSASPSEGSYPGAVI